MTLSVNNAHQLCVEDPETGDLAVLCQEVEVIRNRENLLTGDMTVELGIWINGERKQFEIDRAAFHERRFMTELMRKGLVISDTKETIDVLGDYIIEAAGNAPTECYHDRLGFVPQGKTLLYFADTPVGSSKKSHFYKPDVTSPRGSLDDWKKVIKEEVLGHTPLELALAISFSAPIAHLLQKCRVYAEVPIWAIIGKSSTGHPKKEQD